MATTLGEFTCTQCGRVLDVQRATGGSQPKVVLMLVGQCSVLVCEHCGRVVCSFCQMAGGDAAGLTMSTVCMHCRHDLEVLGIAEDPFAPPLPGPDWKRYVSRDGAFGLSYPPALLDTAQGGSQDNAFAIASSDGRAFVEVLRMTLERPRQEHAVEFIADLFAQHLFDDPRYSRGRVVSRNEVDAGGAERAVRLVVAFREQGFDLTTDYVIRGTGPRVLYIALKCIASERGVYGAAFETMLGTWRTAWLATGSPTVRPQAPPLEDAPTQSLAAVVAPTVPLPPRAPSRDLPPAVASIVRDEAPPRRRSNRSLLWLLVLALAIVATVFAVRAYDAQRQDAATPATSSAYPSDEEKRALVEAYYHDVSAKDYQGAYALLSSTWHNLYQSYTEFAAHYAHTERMTVEVLDFGSQATMQVHVAETRTDGGTVNYYGPITLALEGNPPRWLIAGRDLRTHTPAPVAH